MSAPLLFKKMPAVGRSVCDSLLLMGVIFGLMCAGFFVLIIKDGSDGFKIGIAGVLGFIMLNSLLSCFLMARARPLGRLLAWLVIWIYLFKPLTFYRTVKAMYSPEMNRYLGGVFTADH